MLKNNFSAFYKSTIQLLYVYLVGLIVCMCFRTIHLLSFGHFKELSDFKLDLLHAYWVGFKFDTNVLAYGLSFLFLLNLSILVIPRKAYNYYAVIKKISFWYIVSVFIVFVAILLVDYFFYMFFQSHINMRIFEIVENMRAILTSVWTDYPVVNILIFFVVIIALLTYLTSKILKKEYAIDQRNLKFKMLFVVFSTGLYILALHGSIGPLPLSNEDSCISPNLFLNDLTINGVLSFKETLSERKKKKINIDVASMMKQLGFYFPQEIPNIDLIRSYRNPHVLHDLLFEKTACNPFLKKNPPHVIFILMESMSSYYFDLHSSGLNLLGSLENQLPEYIIFRNFLPYGNGTIQSLEGLLINNPMTSLAQTQFSYVDKSLSSSAALPYLTAGYHTNFITGDRLHWCNLDKFVPKQYFQTPESCADN